MHVFLDAFPWCLYTSLLEPIESCKVVLSQLWRRPDAEWPSGTQGLQRQCRWQVAATSGFSDTLDLEEAAALGAVTQQCGEDI
jgi:hypothetical protein